MKTKRLKGASEKAKERMDAQIPPDLQPILKAHANRLGWSQTRFIAYALNKAFHEISHIEEHQMMAFAEERIARRLGMRANWKDGTRFQAVLKKIRVRESDWKAYRKKRKYRPSEVFPKKPSPPPDRPLYNVGIHDLIRSFQKMLAVVNGQISSDIQIEEQRARALLENRWQKMCKEYANAQKLCLPYIAKGWMTKDAFKKHHANAKSMLHLVQQIQKDRRKLREEKRRASRGSVYKRYAEA